MTRLRTPSRHDRPTARRNRLTRPFLETLEDRTVLTAASAEVATNIVFSLEHFRNMVGEDYATFLNRPADSGGLAGWVSGLQNGMTPEQVEANLAASAEYVAANGGLGEGWVRALYEDFLRRTPSDAEAQSWLAGLTGPSAAYDIALFFATSAERDGLVVTDSYQRFLDRLPEPAGLTYWRGRLDQGATQLSLAEALVGSNEFYRLAGETDPGFVIRAYETVLGRMPADSEVAHWLSVMASVSQTRLVNLTLKPIDLNLLGLRVQTNEITVTVSAEAGEGKLLGNLLTTVTNLINLEGVNKALNTVLDSVVDLVNSVDLTVDGVDTTSGQFSSAEAATTEVLDVYVAPVHLDLLGALVDTSEIHLTVTAQSGEGLVLGNIVSALAHLFDPPLPDTLNLDDLNAALEQLLADVEAAIPGIPSAPISPVTLEGNQILSLTVAPIDLNLLGLLLQTSQIQVNASAESGEGELLGNVLTTLLNTLGATPQGLSDLSNNINALLAKVIGVLNVSTLVLPPDALDSLSETLQTLALPDLVNTTGEPATAPILDLIIASTDGTTPPVSADLLGLVVTTSNIEAQLLAQTGEGQVLGNLLYNVAHLLDPNGAASLLALLNALAA